MHSPFKLISQIMLLFEGYTDFIHLHSKLRNLKMELIVSSQLAKTALLTCYYYHAPLNPNFSPVFGIQ